MATATIGITGGIGAGKSVVSRVLRCNGFIVYDCDSEAKRIMVTDKNVINALKSELGDEAYMKDGTLNREKIAEEIFNKEDKRNFVNSIIHRAVEEDILKKREKIAGDFFIEAALLASSGIGKICTSIWLIDAPEDIRFKRVIKRDNSDAEAVRKRMKSQDKEFSSLDTKKVTLFINDNSHSLLTEILKKTDKFINTQTYNIVC